MRISDTSDSIQILPNSNNLAELTNLVYSYIFNYSKRNVYTLINFDCNILRSIVDKHYILSSICQSNKTNLTIVYNNQNKGLQEQLDSLTQQCCNNLIVELIF
ncbi:hypothetical protein [Orientia tsutsugamushi]|nr:hypothetical protein [Orientia tsutsugamushi]